MKIFFSIFIWFRFSVFVEFILVFGSVTFWYFFYFVYPECGGMLGPRLWKSLPLSTHSSLVFHGWFADVLPSSEYQFNSLLLTFITGVCPEIPCSSVSCFVKTSYLTFITIHLTSCHEMQDLGVGKFRTNNKQFFFW